MSKNAAVIWFNETSYMRGMDEHRVLWRKTRNRKQDAAVYAEFL